MALRPRPELGYPGRTYKFYDGPSVLYPFGYGLSYTTFSYVLNSTKIPVTTKTGPGHFCKHLPYNTTGPHPYCQSIVTNQAPCKEEIVFEVDVTNTGPVAGTESVLVYSKPPPGLAGAPLKQLVAYQKVFLEAKETATLQFVLNSCKALSIVERTAYTVLPQGKHTIQIGDGGRAVSFPVEIKFN